MTGWKRGQSTLEMAFMIAILAGALVTMSIYLKRAMMGHLRSGAQQIGEAYEPRKTESFIVQTSSSESTTHTTLLTDQNIGVGEDGQEIIADITVSTTESPLEQERFSGWEKVGPLGTTLWD
jgi:hypothetical protein